jgi:hypothetical protein
MHVGGREPRVGNENENENEDENQNENDIAKICKDLQSPAKPCKALKIA